MKAYEYILSKQTQWALNNNIKLIGSEGKRGHPAYTKRLMENLFEPLHPSVRKCFKDGDGGELVGYPAKMQAIHSSSALGVNIFQYWLKLNQVPKIAAACGLCNKNNKSSNNIMFETKYEISNKFAFGPNIDVVIENSSESRFKVFAVECKFSEAYSRSHSGLKQAYLNLKNIWKDVPNLRHFSRKISPVDKRFKHLHPSQLVKHILGLKEKYGKNKFRLLYLWYDCMGDESSQHRKEIEEFARIAKADSIRFHSLSYQELIIKISKEYRDSHSDYVHYISSRYL